MDWYQLQASALRFFYRCPENYVSAEDAIRPELAGLQLFDPPLFAAGDAEDPLFLQFQSPDVVGPDFMLPQQWLPEAKTVLSFFFPFTTQVRQSNSCPNSVASDEWLHARIEGQLMIQAFSQILCTLLQQEGFSAIAPSYDPRFRLIGSNSSNWSERHVAYACGLGTFGLSRGLITEKGMAGRFGSIITSAAFPPTARPYDTPFAYCVLCGACEQNCPVGAIDRSKGVIFGKDQDICGPFVRSTFLPPHGPHQRVRYGCGKCQVNVPCESGIPL